MKRDAKIKRKRITGLGHYQCGPLPRKTESVGLQRNSLGLKFFCNQTRITGGRLVSPQLVSMWATFFKKLPKDSREFIEKDLQVLPA